MRIERLRAVETSQTLLLNEQSRTLEKGGRDVFKFGFGQSPFPPIAAAVEALRDHAAAKDYTPVQGLPELRARVAEFHSQVDEVDFSADQVVVAPGSKAIIYSVLAAFEQADVFMAAPAWVSYAPQARLLGHTPVRVQTSLAGHWRVTPESLERALASKADAGVPSILILNYPGNPDGLTYSAAELRQLTDLFRRHNVLVVSDEIYGLLDHVGSHSSLARWYPEGALVTGGLSKWCGAGGWRLGVGLLPKEIGSAFRDTILGIASETYSCASMPVQLAACKAYQWNGATQDYLAHQRRLLAAIGTWLADALVAAGVLVHRPTGGFYLFPDFSNHTEKLHRMGITTSQALCLRLLEDTGVALLPGEAFGMPPQHLCARLAYVEFDGAEALKASAELGLGAALDSSALRCIFAKTIRGTDKLTRWLTAL